MVEGCRSLPSSPTATRHALSGESGRSRRPADPRSAAQHGVGTSAGGRVRPSRRPADLAAARPSGSTGTSRHVLAGRTAAWLHGLWNPPPGRSCPSSSRDRDAPRGTGSPARGGRGASGAAVTSRTWGTCSSRAPCVRPSISSGSGSWWRPSWSQMPLPTGRPSASTTSPLTSPSTSDGRGRDGQAGHQAGLRAGRLVGGVADAHGRRAERVPRPGGPGRDRPAVGRPLPGSAPRQGSATRSVWSTTAHITARPPAVARTSAARTPSWSGPLPLLRYDSYSLAYEISSWCASFVLTTGFRDTKPLTLS